MATALWPCRGLGLGPVALATFFHLRTGDAIVLAYVLAQSQSSVNKPFQEVLDAS